MEKCISKERLNEYLDGMLSGEVHGEVEEHLDRCPQCRKELESLRVTDGYLRVVAHSSPVGVPESAKLSCNLYTMDTAIGYIDKTLDSQLRLGYESHLKKCPQCLQAVMELRRDLKVLTKPSPAPLPAGLKERIKAPKKFSIETVVKLVTKGLRVIESLTFPPPTLIPVPLMRGKDLDEDKKAQAAIVQRVGFNGCEYELRLSSSGGDTTWVRLNITRGQWPGKKISLMGGKRILETKPLDSTREIVFEALPRGDYTINIKNGPSFRLKIT